MILISLRIEKKGRREIEKRILCQVMLHSQTCTSLSLLLSSSLSFPPSLPRILYRTCTHPHSLSLLDVHTTASFSPTELSQSYRQSFFCLDFASGEEREGKIEKVCVRVRERNCECVCVCVLREIKRECEREMLISVHRLAT